MEFKIILIVLGFLAGSWPITKAIKGKDLTLNKGRGSIRTIDYEEIFGWYWGRIVLGAHGVLIIVVCIVVALFFI